MNQKKRTIVLTILIAALLVGASVLYNNLPSAANLASPAPPDNTEVPRVEAPDFTMLNSEGSAVSLSDYEGTPVVLNFWASWCGPCQREMPHFDAVAGELEGEVQFLMVNLTDGGRETMESAAEFIDGAGYAFPVFFDTESKGASAYAVRSIPVTYFVDAEGYLRSYYAGSMSEDVLRAGIATIAQ